MKMKLDDFKINIYRSDIKKEINFNLSNINFAPFGNEKGYQHYKDIFKIILIDIVMKIPDIDLKQKILKNIKFNKYYIINYHRKLTELVLLSH